jgi:proline iminopeptidase
VLGHSWGAQLALAYALAHPDRVTRLVYVSGTGLSPVAWKAEWRAASVRRTGRHAARLRELDAAGAEREASMLRWSADVHDPAKGATIAEAMATPWFPINWQANGELGADVRAHWDEAAVEAACRTLAVPTLILEGAEDGRPRWAIDSLATALPEVTRVTLPGVGHLPWLEAPSPSLAALRAFLEAGR